MPNFQNLFDKHLDSSFFLAYGGKIGLILLFIAIIIGAFFVWAKCLRRRGYEYIYYFLNNIHNFDYYSNYQNHISKFEKYYKRIDKFKDFELFLPNTKRKLSIMVDLYEYAHSITVFLNEHFDYDHYFAFSEIEPINNAESEIIALSSKLSCKEFGKYIRKKRNNSKFDWKKYLEKPFEIRFEQMRLVHNRYFVRKELTEKKSFFDNVLKYPLDIQQRISILKLEDNCQVISSAGSGKTSTSIAKIKYLVEKRGYEQTDILALSYNRATASEFRNRLKMDAIDCSTFHSLARKIVAEVEGQQPDVCSNTLLIECFYDLVSKSPHYKTAVNDYYLDVASATQFEHNYHNSQDYYMDRALYGVICPYTDRNGNIIFTKSEEEKKICVWLVNNGIQFEYERPYHVDIKDPDYRQYKPDFTIFFTSDGVQRYIYYEHFAIDKNGDVPEWFKEGCQNYEAANNKYKAGIWWKRDTHRKYNTALIETTSAMFHDGTIFDNLKKQLKQYGIETHPIREQEKFEKLFRPDCMMRENVKTFFDSFFSLMKSNGKSIDSIMEEVKNSNNNAFFIERNRFLLYEIIKPLYLNYENELKYRRQIDFVDLIIKATRYLKDGKYKPNYKYILVDEFQDISIDRFHFLQALRLKEPFTKLYCVGDDWQSIYRFSGSDINLFSKFEHHFGFTEICNLDTTYRLGNPLIAKSSNFILNNENQVQKNVVPFDKNAVTNIEFIHYSSDNGGHLKELYRIIDSIPIDESILLIGRYNADVNVNVFPPKSITKETDGKKATVAYKGRTMKFMSIHAAKGLEADNVIILNCSADGRGFPSRVADDPILGYVLSEVDNYPFSEERRLFYVGITRAKKKTYVLYNEAAPSIFVNEMNENNAENMTCPKCGKGILVLKFRCRNNPNSWEFRIYRCSNLAANCDFCWKDEFMNDNDVYRKYTELFLKKIKLMRKHRYVGPSKYPILHKVEAPEGPVYDIPF